MSTPIAVPSQYAQLFETAGAKWGVRPALLAAVAYVEDGFGTGGFTSGAGAEGFMQFEPGTAAEYGVDVHSIPSSIDGAAHYLSDLQKQTGSEQNALAAYNAGPGNLAAGQSYAATVLSDASRVTGLSASDVGAAAAAGAAAVAAFVFPLAPGYTETQAYHDPKTGGTHPGVDLSDPAGTPIYAVTAGTIKSVGGDPSGFGNDYPVELLADGTTLTYGHAEKSFVQPGQAVTAGQIIALVGTEGDSTGDHLHFQVNLPGGATTDPLAWLAQEQASPTVSGTTATAQTAGLLSSLDPLSGVAGAITSGIKTLVFYAIKGVLVLAGGALVVIGVASTTGKPVSLPSVIPIPV